MRRDARAKDRQILISVVAVAAAGVLVEHLHAEDLPDLLDRCTVERAAHPVTRLGVLVLVGVGQRREHLIG